jgi:DUF4097 and DUF4098 domain-containing protein YvlB
MCGLLAAGCSRSSPTYPIPVQTRLLPAGHELVIILDQASLIVSGVESSFFTITGSASKANLQVEVMDLADDALTQIQLSNSTSSRLDKIALQLQLPLGTSLKIIQAKGDVFVHDFEGLLYVDAVSASIRLEGFHGGLVASSRRGQVLISDSRGDIHALAEADGIWLSNLRGNSTATNIMGSINFSSMIASGDTAKFETDHGDVNIYLTQGSSAEIELTSAGGRIVCTLPGLSGMFERCTGTFGNGAGALTIRTVSGEIILNQAP